MEQAKDIVLRGGEQGVLLLHGLQSSPLEVLHLGRRLHAAGYSVRIPHIEGYGFGTPVQRWQAWIAAAEAQLAELGRTCSSVAVGGLCIGAVLALLVASQTETPVSAVISLAPTLRWDGWAMPWYRFLAPLAYYTPLRFLYSFPERWPFGVKDDRLRRWISGQMRATGTSSAGASRLPMTSIYEAARLIRRVIARLPRITAPALVIHAREDDVASPRNAELLMRRIGSRRKRFVLLEDSYHMITLDREKEFVAEECLAFLRPLGR